jgi:hypothetical protein
MRLYLAGFVRRGALAADHEGDHADGNDYGEYEQGRHHPPQGKFRSPPPLRQAAKSGRGFGPRPDPVS